MARGALTMTIGFCLVLLLTSILGPASAGVISDNDIPSPVDSFVQFIWDPSALIRMWVALDQFSNIARGWRSAASTVLSLPFRNGRAYDDHVTFQKPRRFKYGKITHGDRFKMAYAASDSAPTFHRPQMQVHQQGSLTNVDMNYLQALQNADSFSLQNFEHLQSQLMPFSSLHTVNAEAATSSQNTQNGNLLFQNQHQLPFSSFHAVSAEAAASSLPIRNGNMLFQNEQRLQSQLLPFKTLPPLIMKGPADSQSIQNGDVFFQNQQQLQNQLLPFNSLPRLNNNGLTNPQSLQRPHKAAFMQNAPYDYELPPPFLFQPQEVFANLDGTTTSRLKLPKNSMSRGDGLRMKPLPQESLVESSNINVQKLDVGSGNLPLALFGANAGPNVNPQARLNMALKLFKTLGEIHTKNLPKKHAPHWDDDGEVRSSKASDLNA